MKQIELDKYITNKIETTTGIEKSNWLMLRFMNTIKPTEWMIDKMNSLGYVMNDSK